MTGRKAKGKSAQSAAMGVDACNRFWTAARTPTIGRRLVVVGVRRSGNHAIINWLVNALAGTPTELQYPPVGLIGVSSDGRIVHANDLTTSDNRYFLICEPQIGLLEGADSLILSFEDQSADAQFDRVVDGLLGAAGETDYVLVRRSTLNTLASRLQGLRRKSMHGTTQQRLRTNPKALVSQLKGLRRRQSKATVYPGLDITQHILDVMSANCATISPRWVVVDFDDWAIGRVQARRAILHSLRLEHDVEPSISLAGNGSSFTNRERVPTATELTTRWEQIDWPQDLVELLLRPRNIGLLTETEISFLMSLSTSES